MYRLTNVIDAIPAREGEVMVIAYVINRVLNCCEVRRYAGGTSVR
jgi:hypothetical protein